MVTIKDWAKREERIALRDLEAGDTFVFLSAFPDSVFLVADNDDFVNIVSGEIYDYYEYDAYSVGKVNLEVTVKN